MIAIKGIEMPRSCAECRVLKCSYPRGALGLEFRPKDCLLVEIVTCKDCKYWRDSDGKYRRGVHAESKCPINRKDVFEGHAYCSYGERRE